MERIPNIRSVVYSRSEMSDSGWREMVISKFSDFLTECYQGIESSQSQSDSETEGTVETIESDVIFTLEDRGRVVGMTAVKLIPNISGYSNVLVVKEIAVLPEYQGRKLSGLLRSLMLQELKPDLIFGIASNPRSALSRATSLSNFGYQTYWANVPLTDCPGGSESITQVGDYIAHVAYPDYAKTYDDGVMVYTDYDIWAEQSGEPIPQTAQTALSKIIDFQIRNGHPAMATLISVKAN